MLMFGVLLIDIIIPWTLFMCLLKLDLLNVFIGQRWHLSFSGGGACCLAARRRGLSDELLQSANLPALGLKSF